MSALAEALIAELRGDEAALRALAEHLRPWLAIPVASQPEDGWLDAKGAAAYLSISLNVLHKHTAARTIPFHQEAPGCKCWFKPSELDAWRRGERERLRATFRHGASKMLPRNQISFAPAGS